MSEPTMPKRRFWQIHLSTAVVLMLVTGGIVGLNIKHDRIVEENFDYSTAFIAVEGAGWPIAFRLVGVEKFRMEERFETLKLIYDILIAAFLLSFVAVAFEYPIRRRERSKP